MKKYTKYFRRAPYGQATIEFLMTFIFGFGFLFLFSRLSLNYTAGFYNHYATFMASRAFLVHDQLEANVNGVMTNSLRRAQNAFDKYRVDLWISDTSAQTLKLAPLGTSQFNQVGLHNGFEVPMSDFGPLGGNIFLNLYSESYLGKEPTRYMCRQQINEIMRRINGGGSENMKQVTLFDNGC